MKSVIVGGTLVAEGQRVRRDIEIEAGRITRVADRIGTAEADLVFDATGRYVFPGFIDPHVHSRDPGGTHKEDFAHSTKAALLAGITTILEMPNTAPPLLSAEMVAPRAEYLQERAFTDFGLWALVLGNESQAQLASLREAGVVAAKLFWGYSFDKETMTLVYGADKDHAAALIPPADNGAVWSLLRAAAHVDLLIGFHCEDRSVVEAATREIGTATSLQALTRTRPASAEAVSVATLVELVRDVGGRAHVVHVSSAPTVHLLRRAHADGLNITGETCPHYLTFSTEDLASAGSSLKAYPPVRGTEHAGELWEALQDSTILSVGSDHAPHSCAERQGPFGSQPAGIGAVQTSTRLMLDAAAREQISLEQVAEVMSTGTAKIYGLYPRKGSLMAGADADITIVDMDRGWSIDAATLATKTPLSPWIGRTGRGVPVAAFLRGQLVMQDGEVRGAPTGRFVPRPPSTGGAS